MIATLLSMAKRSSIPASSPEIARSCEKIVSLNYRSWPTLPLESGRFIVFDTETTGLACNKGDEIISLGAVVIENGSLTDSTFSQLINPCREIPALATEITGITDEMVAEAPDFFTVLEQFLEFSQGSMLIAHNGHFDLGFINSKLRKYCSNRLRPALIDTYILSHLVSPSRRSHSLDSLASFYGISLEERHTALGDSIITGKLFLTMVEDLMARGIKTTAQLFEYLQFRRLL
ncbi:MAG: 3'-5' exonuclease [Desulfitobacteriaceae bacterium]